MALEIYRRHNSTKCSSKDSKQCVNRRRPCPIWVRGTTDTGSYIREPLKLRDWTRAEDVRREMELTGKLPKVALSEREKRTTIEVWRDKFMQNAPTENISEETLRKYNLIQIPEEAEQYFLSRNLRGVRFKIYLRLKCGCHPETKESCDGYTQRSR